MYNSGKWFKFHIVKQSAELSRIIKPIIEDIKLFQEEFEVALKSEVRLINIITKYVIRHKGKGIRPILTILAARMTGGPTLNSYKAAAIVELLHIATLLHDDVVDDAEKRRGFPTINKLWKNKTAIIMGDFLLSKVLENLIRLRDFDALDLISTTAERLSTGEMIQIEKSIKKNMSEEVYYKMIKNKTASLLATCCEIGVITSSNSGQERESLREFGENFGMAFQIKDDLFDILGSEHVTGKDTNSDITKNMITLPIIHTLSSPLTASEKVHLKKTLYNHSSKKDIKRLTKIVVDYGGFEYAQKKIDHFTEAAIEALSIFPDSEYKTSIIELATYNVNRTN